MVWVRVMVRARAINIQPQCTPTLINSFDPPLSPSSMSQPQQEQEACDEEKEARQQLQPDSEKIPDDIETLARYIQLSREVFFTHRK